MTAPIVSTGTGVALLADLDPGTRRPERIHAVLGWTDLGECHYQPLLAPVSAAGCRRLAGTIPAGTCTSAVQLSLDIDGLDGLPSTSSGRTWRTWSLPSIPPTLRDRSLAGVVREIATQLGG